MNIESLTKNQLSDSAWAWYQEYLSVLDSKDLEAYGKFLDESVELTMNNQPTVIGKHAVLAGLGAYWTSFGALVHEPQRIYGSDRAFVLEALNHYVRLDGTKVTLRAVAFTDRNAEGFVTSVRLYTDTLPLFGH